MSAHAYTEEQLVEQPAIQVFKELGWQTVSVVSRLNPMLAPAETRDGMPSGLVFDGKPKAQVARPAKRAKCPANSRFFLFDGYLME